MDARIAQLPAPPSLPLNNELRLQRCAPGAPDGKPLLGTSVADLRLDSVDRLQAFDTSHANGEWVAL